MITPETAEKLRDLGFPLISVGKEDHQYAADFCRFCGFPFLKIGDTYYLMPVINVILTAFGGGAFEGVHVTFGRAIDGCWEAQATLLPEPNSDGSGRDLGFVCDKEPDETLCLLWIRLREENKI
jgi:hypothetical protein